MATKKTTKKATSKTKKATTKKAAPKTKKLKVLPQAGKKSDTESDKNVSALPSGQRVSKKFAEIAHTNPKTGKLIVTKRRNANQTGKVEGGKKYTETRKNRSDSDSKKWL